MSKKHKSNRQQAKKPAAKVAAPPAAVKATNGRGRQAETAPSMHKRVAPAPVALAPVAPPPVAPVPPVARADDGAVLPFWARMPFAMMDFWMSRAARGSSKS